MMSIRNRHVWSLAIFAASVGLLLLYGSYRSTQRVWRELGPSTPPNLREFDQLMKRFMTQHDIPAGALAISYKSRLVFAKGYSWATADGDVIEPDSIFRIGSVSKPLTAAAIFRLVDEGKLALDERVVTILNLMPPPRGKMDPRLPKVTVLHLLQHMGGWDGTQTFDPMCYDEEIARSLQCDLPIDVKDIITFMNGQALQHDPGSVWAYSSYGYCLLGRIVEKRSGMSYGEYVQSKILRPLGITRMRLAKTLRSDRAAGEVQYVATRDESPYGFITLENADSAGGWAASSVDLVRFAAAFDDPHTCPILSPASIDRMFALPANIAPGSHTPGVRYYACGWHVCDYGQEKRSTWHFGSVPGLTAILCRWQSGFNFAVLFNKREIGAQGNEYYKIGTAIRGTAEGITNWPECDLFEDML